MTSMNAVQSAVPSANHTRGIQTRRRWRIFAVTLPLLAACIAALVLVLTSSYQNALLREMYLPELEQRVRREPANGKLLTLLAVRLLEARQYRQAAARWEQAAGAGEKGDMLWRTWAATVAATGDRVKATAVLKLGIARDTKAAPILQQALDRLAAAPESAGPMADAIFTDGIRQASVYYTRPNFWSSFLRLSGQRDPARSGFATREYRANAEPENAAAQRLWAEALLTNGRYSEAESILQKLTVQLPNDAELHAALGDALRQQNRAADAGRAYRVSLDLEKDNARALLGIGRTLLTRNLIRLAVPVYQKATTLYPENADAWIGTGDAHYAQRLNFAGAVEAFEKARNLAPERTEYFNGYANALRAAGRYQQAEGVLRERLAAAPEDARAHYLLALLLLDFEPSAERRSDAEAQLRESLRYEPTSATVQGRLGQLLVDSGRFSEALPLLEAALRTNNRDITHLRSFATALRKTGQTERAEAVMESLKDVTEYKAQVQALQDAQALRPADKSIHLRLAALFEQGGDLQKARFHREVVRMLETNPDLARRSLSELRDAMARITAQ